MSRKEFDEKLRKRALSNIKEVLRALKGNDTNVHIMALSIFEGCVIHITGIWDMSWGMGPPDNVSNQQYALRLLEQAQLHVQYICRCDENLAAEIVQDVISRI